MPSDGAVPEESLADLIESLEWGAAEEPDADVNATAELSRRLRGDGAPLTLSADLADRLAGLAGDAPAAVWTLFEPDTVAQCHALSAASGADVTVANTLEPLDALVSEEGIDPAELLARGASLAARAATPFAVAALRPGAWELPGLDPDAGCPGINGVLVAGVASPEEARRALEQLRSGLPVLLVPDADAWEAQPDPLAWRVSDDVAALGVEGSVAEALATTERDARLARNAGLGWVVRADVSAAAPEQCEVAFARLYEAGATAVGLTGPVTPAHSQALRQACDEAAA